MTAAAAPGGPGARDGAVPALEVDALTVHHGQLPAVREVSLRVQRGETFAIIGANGAGKSTLLRAIVGLHRPSSGRILLEGEDVTGLPPRKRTAAGVALVPEGRRLFPSLSVEENLLAGAHHARKGPWDLERVYALFDWMAARRRQGAGVLSGGEQQAVAIGRALLTNPRVLLLDELSLGLAPIIVQRIYDLLPELLGSGVTILLVEQDVGQALRVASQVQCLLEGRVTLEGRPGDFTTEQVERAYFGLAAAAGSARGAGHDVG
ncbi:MAG: ABC transporter ATP-binding protein [Acidimicrobiales bacterium]